MSRSTLAPRALGPASRAALVSLGEHLTVARKRRRISLRDMAARMSVSVGTVQRLEKGDPGVGIGILALALFTLQLIDRLATLIAPQEDLVGRALELRRLPERIRHRKAAFLDF